MKLAICNECFEDWALDTVFDYAGKLGYDGVEVAPFTLTRSVEDVSRAERDRLRAAAAHAGVEIVGLHWILASQKNLHITHPDKTVREKTREYFHALIAFCGDLGGKVIVIGSPKNRNILPPATPEQAWDYARETFAHCCDHAAECGVTLCIEPLDGNQTNFINRPEQGVRMVEAVAHPNFKLILDVCAMSGEHVDIPQAIEACAPHLAHFHANDDNRSYPGSGGADYHGIAEALKKTGYTGYVSVEVFDFKPDPKTIATRAFDFLHARLGR